MKKQRQCADISGDWYHGDRVSMKKMADPKPDAFALYFAQDAYLAQPFGRYLHRVLITGGCIFDADRQDFKPFLDQADRLAEKMRYGCWRDFSEELRAIWSESLSEDPDQAGAVKSALDQAGAGERVPLVLELFRRMGYDGYVFDRSDTRELVLLDHKLVKVKEIIDQEAS